MNDQFPIRQAPFIICKFLQWRKLEALTAPWGVIYITPYADYLLNHWDYKARDAAYDLIEHERIHEQQIKREGPWKFTAKYLWYLVRYGYWNHPYEKEARGGKE